MLGRKARPVAPGYPHHVTQRGNYQQNIFKDEDCRRYNKWLEENSCKEGLKIRAYCLMTNHVHFVCVPDCETSLSRTFNTVHMRYAQYFNKKGRELKANPPGRPWAKKRGIYLEGRS